MWFQAMYPFKAQQILNQNLSLVVAKVMYAFNPEIYTGKQPDYPHQVAKKPADNIKGLVEPVNDTEHNITLFYNSQRGSCLVGALLKKIKNKKKGKKTPTVVVKDQPEKSNLFGLSN
jgi:hypothetical protein